MFLINSRYCELSDCQHSALWREATKGKKRVCQDHREKGVAYSQIAAICAKEASAALSGEQSSQSRG